MTVTKDIARETGKSITTVSRALNDYGDVSEKTKELVRRTAEEMDYTPNLFAQRLQKQRTETIGLILPTFGPRFADPFFSEFLAGVGKISTTVHQPIYQIGSMVCEMLLDTLLGKGFAQRHAFLKPTLIVPQSCGSNHSVNGATDAIPEREVLYT